jgi:hypothetical protein
LRHIVSTVSDPELDPDFIGSVDPAHMDSKKGKKGQLSCLELEACPETWKSFIQAYEERNIFDSNFLKLFSTVNLFQKLWYGSGP